MRPTDNIHVHKMIKKLHLRASTELDKRVHDDISRALAESEKKESATAQPNIWRTIMETRITKLAAAAAIIIAVLFGIGHFGLPDRTSIAFADVLEQIRTFRPYVYSQTTEYEGKAPYTWRVMKLSLSRRREIRPDGRIYVFDMSQKPVRILILYPQKKRAIEETLTAAGPARDPDILRILSAIQDGTEEDLGVREINGRVAKGFHVPDQINDFTVWADGETGLPMRIELRQARLGRTIIMEDFEFDVDFDESLFSTTAPEGYTVERLEKAGVNPTQQDLVEGLRTVAAFLDGEFPAVFEFGALLKVFKEHVELRNLSPSEDQMTSLREAARGALKYVELLEDFYRVTDLRYVGPGVKLGDAGSPVLLWRFKASETYRVVYGDLSVGDVSPEDLPEFSEEKSSDLLKLSDGFRPYICTYTVEYKDKPARSYRLMRLSLSRRREVYPDGRILVVDLSQKPVRMLELFPEEKRAVETILSGRGPAKDPDLLRMAVDLQDGTEEDLGVRQLGGRKARGFRAARPGNDFTFWVDPETELPVRIEIVHTGSGRRIILSNFELDVDLDESLFSATAPEAYTVRRVEKADK